MGTGGAWHCAELGSADSSSNEEKREMHVTSVT